MKEKVIQATIDLIKESEGDVDQITIRKIATKAGVGIGLINYHFGSKENLIAMCVENIIHDVVKSYQPKLSESDERKRVYGAVQGVADYLWGNKQVSRISILSDFQNPKQDDNTMRSIQNFIEITNEPDPLKAFIMVTVLQAVFLKAETLKELLGLDASQKDARHTLIERIADVVIFGGRHENSDI